MNTNIWPPGKLARTLVAQDLDHDDVPSIDALDAELEIARWFRSAELHGDDDLVATVKHHGVAACAEAYAAELRRHAL